MLRLLLLTLGLLSCQALGASLPAVPLTPDENAPDLREFVRYSFVDADFEVDRDVPNVALDDLRRVREPTIDFGVPDQPILVMLRVRNEGDKTGTWTFSTDRGSLRRIDLFELDDSGGLTERLRDDDQAGKVAQLREFHAFAFNFTLAPGEERTLGVVFDAENSTQMLMTIMEPNAYQRLINRYLVVALVAATGTLTLVLINALLFGATGRMAFFHFVIAELAMIYQALHQAGYSTIYLFPDNGELARGLAGIAKVVFGMFSVRFARSFLNTRETLPGFDRVARGYDVFCWVVLGALVFHQLLPGVDLRMAGFLSFGVGAIALMVLPFVALSAVRRFGNIYIPMFMSWCLYGGYLLYLILTLFTPIPEIPDMWRWMGPVGFLEAFLLCVALGLDVRQVVLREAEAQDALNRQLIERVRLLEASTEVRNQRDIAEQELIDSSRLLRSTAHDSRNFIGALRIYSHALTRTEDPVRIKEHAERIDTITEHLDSTLGLALGHGAGSSLSRSVRCLESVDGLTVLNTVKMIHEQAARQHQIQIHCRARPGDLVLDKNAVIRVLSNLVSNAIKYAAGGKLLLTLRQQGEELRFQVWDQGRGIAPERLAHLLRADHSGQRMQLDTAGDGTGLNICHRLAERMGGHISGRSRVGRGSLFELVLPRPRPEVDDGAHIAIVDLPEQWPPQLLDASPLQGSSITFHATLEDARSAGPDLICLDPAFTEPRKGLDGDAPLIISSFDKSGEFRLRWAPHVNTILQKPVSVQGLLSVLQINRVNGHVS